MGGFLDTMMQLLSTILGPKSSSISPSMEEMKKQTVEASLSSPVTGTVGASNPSVGIASTEPSQSCIQLIKQFEGCRLSTYQDSVGIPTIGYGHTAGVVLGSTITAEEAEWFLKTDLRLVAKAVRVLLQVPVNQNQFDALCCFSFNVGVGNLAKSTLLKQINNGNINKASEEFLRWTKAGGIELKGLVSRRKAEKALFERAGI